MNQAGPFNPAFGVEKFGDSDLNSISYNIEAASLVEGATWRGETKVAKSDALDVETGIHTGRSPNHGFTARALTENMVWSDISKSMTLEAFDLLDSGVLARAKGNDPYAQDLYGDAWSAPADGASLIVTALTASKLAWAQ